MNKIGKLKMRTIIYSFLFAICITLPFYLVLRWLNVNLFLIGVWFGLLFDLSRQVLFFRVFPKKQKYIITLMGYGVNKGNLYVKSFDGKDGYTTTLLSEAMVFDYRDDAFLTIKSPVFTKIKESKVGYYPTVDKKYST